MTNTTARPSLDPASVRAALRARLGDGLAFDGVEPYTVDALSPVVAMKPPTEESLSDTLRALHAESLAVIPHGGGTMRGLGNLPAAYDAALDVRGLDGVVEYEPDDFTITVQAGMPLGTLQATLARHGQFVPIDAPAFERASVGGVLAVGRTGLRRAAFAGPRDWLIGCRAALADGTLVKGGGRVVKNVSGYDLPKLFCGSLGTLGVITEASFKLRPLPAFDRILALPAEDFEAALLAGRAAAQAAPELHGVIALNREVAKRAGIGSAALVLRGAGLEAAATDQLERARTAALALGRISAEAATPPVTETWQALVDLEDTSGAHAVRLRCGIVPSRLAEAAGILEQRLPAAERWAAADSGIVYMAPRAEADPQGLAIAIGEARSAIERLSGHLTVEDAPPALKALLDVWGSAGQGGPLMRRIKKRFDPGRRLNPGRFVEGL